MITIKQEDILHKNWMQKLLIAVIDDPVLSQNVYFKGGTCAAMLGFLDRFSVDLDFDIVDGADQKLLFLRFIKIFEDLDLILANPGGDNLFFKLKYKAPENKRNTLKISVFEEIVKSNIYKKTKIKEIDRLVVCQTIETMFANKLVSITDRFKRHNEIAGRDMYDIYYFFGQGYNYNPKIIEERTGVSEEKYIKKLVKFIENRLTDKIVNEDLNTLLPTEKFTKIRKTLKQDTLLYLRNLI